MTLAAHFAFYRTLYSQSAASLTVSTTAAAVRATGRTARLTLLVKGDHLTASALVSDRPASRDSTILFIKVNFQDASEALPLADALARRGGYGAVLLFGTYSAGNATAILGRYPNMDGIVVGEPERIVPAALAALEQGTSLHFVPGIVTASQDSVADTPERPTPPRVVNLDDIEPVRDIELEEPGRLANVESSRGCIAACSFCHVPVVEQRFRAPRRRLRSIDRVVADIEYLVGIGKRYFIFNDPVFWGGPGDTERVRELGDRLGKIRPRIHFMIYLRLAPFPDEELLAALVRNGLIRVFVGVESDSAETLKLYRKGTAGPSYGEVRELLDRHRISHHIGFLMFNPFSTLEQIRRDVEFLREHDQLHRIGVVLERTRLVPGTSLGIRAAAAGLVAGERHPLSCDAAYSWGFQHDEVGEVHRHLQRTLTWDFAGRGKYLEYYHTSSGLLRFMIEHHGEPGIDVESLWGPLDTARRELADLLHGFYLDAIDRAAVGQLHEAEEGEFLSRLSELAAQTQVAYAELLAEVRAFGHGEAIESLFTSREGY